MSNSPQFEQPAQKYFSLKSARKFAKDFADFELSEASFYRLSSQGNLPVIRHSSGRLLIPIDEFKSWLEGGEVNGDLK